MKAATGLDEELRDRKAAGRPVAHESARAQVAGAATYVDDIAEPRGTLFAAPILSGVAHGRLTAVDADAALAMPGVRGLVLSHDIPGSRMLASFAGDEPVFAIDRVEYVGQVVGLIVADSVMQARRAARRAPRAARAGRGRSSRCLRRSA